MITCHRATVFVLFLSVLPGCGPDAASEQAVQSAGSSASGQSAATEQAALNDPQIAHVAVTANTIDVEMARIAESRTTTPEVLAFAETMITDHTAVNERATALAQRLGLTPEENEVSSSLRADAAAARTELEVLSGEAFDRAYVEREVAYHQAVLDALDQTLIPGATNEELRRLLQEVRPAIAAHLEHARSLQSPLAARQ